MTLFEHTSYKKFLQERLKSMPRRGHGELRKMAQALRIHTTRMSQIYRGNVHLSFEQAAELCHYLGLTQNETEYFFCLLQFERAGSQNLKKTLLKQMERYRQSSQEVVNRVHRDKILNESEKSFFYSDWIYSGVRLATSIKQFQTIDGLSARFQVPREKLREILDFLVSTGLCVQEDDRYRMGPKSTHLEARSRLVNRHHANWRMKALARHESISTTELIYTCPVSVSGVDQMSIRKSLLNFIEGFNQQVSASVPEEKLACLCIDWFEF